MQAVVQIEININNSCLLLEPIKALKPAFEDRNEKILTNMNF